MRSVNVYFAISFFLLPVQPIQAKDSPQWIVLGEDAAKSFATHLSILDDGSGGLESRFGVIETTGERTVAMLDSELGELLRRFMHTAHHRCGGYTVHLDRESALAEAKNPFYSPDYRADPDLFPRTIDQQVHVQPALRRIDKSQIVATIQRLQSLGTRYYASQSGQTAAQDLLRQWKGYGAGRSDFSVHLYSHDWRQNSVIATIQGAEIPSEIVVLGGHLDSINTRNQNAAPGADDDASGIAVVSEVLRVILESGFRPKRTLQFMAYAAEEVGLRGSSEIARAYRDGGKRVIAALQVDMTGYPGSEKNMYFITDYVSGDLNAFLKDLIREYNSSGANLITYGETACGYACSDHVPWTGTGVAAAFPFEASFHDYNQHVHTANDRIANIDGTGAHQARFAKLGIEFMMELGKSAVTTPPPRMDRYLYTTLRTISSGSDRGCRANDWTCMTQLCKGDLGESAWRGWSGCWQNGARFICNFECGIVRQLF